MQSSRFIAGFLRALGDASGRCWETGVGVIQAAAASRYGSSCSCLLCPGVVLSSATTPRSSARYGKPRWLPGWGWQLRSEPFRHLGANSRSARGEPRGCKKWGYCWPPELARLARDRAAGLLE